MYNDLFGDVERELQRATLDAANSQRRAELFAIRLQRGQSLDANTVKLLHEIVDKEFAVYSKREQPKKADKTDEPNAANTQPSVQVETDVHRDEIGKLYKSIVKKLHPDIHGETDEYTAFWQAIQVAYQQRDVQRLRSIHAVLGIEEAILTQASVTSESLDDLRRSVYQLEMRVDYEQRKLARLKNDEPFTLRENLNNPAWCKQHRDGIEQQIRKQRRLKDVANEQLTLMLGATWEEVYAKNASIRETFDFNDDFLENTYFSGRM